MKFSKCLLSRSLRPFLLVSALCLSGVAHAQQVLALSPGLPPEAKLVTSAFATPNGGNLRIENLKINDANPSVVNLELRRTEVVSGSTEFIVIDDKGPRPYPLARSAHFSGSVQGQPNSYAFVAISPDGEIRIIIHKNEETIVNELLPITNESSGRVASRAVDHYKDFPEREFTCGADEKFLKENLIANITENSTERSSSSPIPPSQEIVTMRRADIIIDTDYEFFQKFGTESAAFTYITNLLAYISSKYQNEISTKFNLKQINVRSTSADPWTKTSTSEMLDELRTYWNNPANAAISRHHVHLISGKNVGGGIAYVNTLSPQYVGYAYGVSANILGNFNPSNPQVIWDSVVVAHEIGHAFGSGHTHTYDNPYVAPNPNIGGAIDCCYSDNSNGQCGTALGGAGRYGQLPGFGSITGGAAGQGNGTIMSYCHLLNGGMGNIAWTFGKDHVYGVNANRVPTVMTTQSQAYLPADTSGTFDLSVSKTAGGTVTSSPTGINCGVDCAESYAIGTNVTLTAVADAGYQFSGWAGACSGTGGCTVTMDGSKTVSATFTQTPKGTLSVAKIGTGNGTVTRIGGQLNCGSTCIETLQPGTTVNLIATADAGSTFAGWSSGTCSGTGSCAFTLNSNITVNATFNATSGGRTVTPLTATDIQGTSGSMLHYSVTVPENAKNLVIKISGGTGDADLYVKYNQTPTINSYDCRSNKPGNNETCTFQTPYAGTYSIMIRGESSFSGLTLSASYQEPPSNMTPIINLLLLN